MNELGGKGARGDRCAINQDLEVNRISRQDLRDPPSDVILGNTLAGPDPDGGTGPVNPVFTKLFGQASRESAQRSGCVRSLLF